MEVVRFPSRGGFSVRSILTFVLAVLATVLLWVTISGQPTHAQASGATWGNENTILYDNHGYTRDTAFNDPTNTIPDGAIVYKTSVQTVGNNQQKVFVLYFSSGVDPPTATSAKYVEFNYNNGTLSNAANQRDVTMTPEGQEDSYQSSCSVGGIGWIVCPVSVFLAEAMDNMFNILSTMISVQPLVFGDTNNSLYTAWNIARTIANVAFVIAFLIIIFSQLTNLGVSNYGLKKLTPRLIVAAVLVNISFIVSAVAIDISNVLGYSIQDVFNAIREQLFSLTNDDLNNSAATETWTAVTALILAGGGVLAGGMYFAAAGGLYLLLPLLLGLLLTIIFVVIVLAARQAIIIVLVIVAPLAFVANLLPNTEKWFDKWRDLFMTMLIFFPAFSLVFGGSQLAGQIIIQNAGDNIIMLLFGMAVQIAPLVITPLLLKFSGSLLGRIAQIANNPRKGMLDRSKNWAQARAEHAKQQNMARGPRLRNPASWGAAMVKSQDFRKRRLSDSTDAWKQEATNNYERTAKYEKLHLRKAEAEEDKNAIHSQHAAHLDNLRATPGNKLHDRALNAQGQKEYADAAQQRAGAYYNSQRLAGGGLNASFTAAEAAKTNFEASEQDKSAYVTQQRSYRVTQLGMAAERLEAAKLNNDGMQSRYTSHIDGLKLSSTSNLGDAARFAQSSKDHAEAAQTRVTAMFDSQRTNVGSVMNTAAVDLEGARISGEGAKSQFAEYITETKSARGTTMHAEYMATERHKQGQQISEAKLTRVVDEYKSGAIDPTILNVREQTLMREMAEDSIVLNAEKQGATAAQYEMQRNIAETMSGTGPLTDAMLDIAQGVGGDTARVRAQAQAVSTKQKLDSEALGANVGLLKAEAQSQGSTVKRYTASIVDSVLKGDTHDVYGHEITPERLKSALQAQADEKNMSLFEKVRGSRNFNQQMVSEVIALNVPTFKGAGGFHLQEDPDLNIDNFASDADFNKAMQNSRVQSLANASANGLSSVKFGWLANFANDDPTKGATLADNIAAAKQSPNGEKYLRMAYTNVREALTNNDIRATIGDREDEIRLIEAALANEFGEQATPDDRPQIP